MGYKHRGEFDGVGEFSVLKLVNGGDESTKYVIVFPSGETKSVRGDQIVDLSETLDNLCDAIEDGNF